MKWKIEYLTGGRWLPWKTVSSKKRAEAAVTNRKNLSAICRIMPEK